MSDEPAPPPQMRPAQPAQGFKTSRTIGALVLRDMQTTYGRTPGGYAWTLLEPIGGITLLALLLAVGFRIREPSLGTNFPLFLATGLLVLNAFMATSGKLASSIGANRSLLVYPSVKYTDTLIASFILVCITQVLVIYLILIGIHIVFDLQTILNLGAVVSCFLLTALLGLGIGTLNCFLFEVYPLWASVWRVMTRPLFILSCVMFTFEDIPLQFQDYAWWNPLVHVVGLMRRGIYPTYDASYVSPVYVALVGSITLMLGLLFLHRFHRDILNR